MTSDQIHTVFVEGGLRETVKLSGRDLILGELKLRDRPKIFDCIEGDLKKSEEVWNEWIREGAGFMPNLASFFRKFLGAAKKKRRAISIMKSLIEGLTENDIKLLLLCSLEFNPGRTEREIRKMILDAPYSEVQTAVRKALEVNGIDTKKSLAAREMAILSDAASQTMTSIVGSPESSNIRDGQENK